MRARLHRPRVRTGRHAGFTLVELAVVIGVLGLLAMTMASTFDSVGQARQHNAARAHAESARQALRTFALRNKRLPCPDTTLHGDIGREAGGAPPAAPGLPPPCPGGADVGWLPYESLGLDTPVRALRLRYGVHRGAGGADLVAPQPASADAPDLEGTGGFLAALTEAARAAASSAHPHYVTGTGAASTCSPGGGASLVNPAFVLVAPVSNRDGDGQHPGFDGDAHRAFADGTGKCTAPPGHPADDGFDDLVVAESHTTLLGWVMSTTR